MRSLFSRRKKIANRWSLVLEKPLVLRTHRVIYKVSSPWGSAALKVYSEVNAAGERLAVPFYRGLPKGLGLDVYKVSPLRRAVLMEWLDGPSLADLVEDGQEAVASQYLARVSKDLHATKFPMPYRFPSLATRIRKKLYKSRSDPRNQQHAEAMQRTINLLKHMLNTAPGNCVVHGDLHYKNVILTSDGPRIFDPKGNRAEPALEFGKALIAGYARAPVAEFSECIVRRSEVFGEGVEAKVSRILKWGAIAYAVRVFDGNLSQFSPDETAPLLAKFLDLADA